MSRRFLLVRDEDVSGMSGTGHVAEGIEFWDGKCVIHWMTEVRSTGIYESIDEVEFVHGHEGRTRVQWIESDPAELTAFRDALERVHTAWRTGDGMTEAMYQVAVALTEYE